MRRATDPGRPGSGIVVIISGESAVSTRILALFNLRDGTTPAAYEQWARTTDLPVVNALPSIERFEVFRVTGRLGGDTAIPYAYAEVIDVRDMAAFSQDVATPRMQAVASEFAAIADTVFLTTEPQSGDDPKDPA